jgi:AGCS family alanine or glycine:cation symporter
MLGTFIDTLVVCSITGLAIVVSGEWTSGSTGAELTSNAFATAIPYGNYIVAIALTVFAFTTILGWSVYGEKCVQYFFGVKAIMPFRILWILVVPVGAIGSLEFIWLLADTMNALMALPNLIALVLLSPVVIKLTREYFVSGGEAPAEMTKQAD